MQGQVWTRGRKYILKLIQLHSALSYLLNRGRRTPQKLWCSCRICCSRRFLQPSAAAAWRPARRVSPPPRHLAALWKPTKKSIEIYIFITLGPDSYNGNSWHVCLKIASPPSPPHPRSFPNIPHNFDPIPPDNFWAAAWHQALAGREKGDKSDKGCAGFSFSPSLGKHKRRHATWNKTAL